MDNLKTLRIPKTKTTITEDFLVQIGTPEIPVEGQTISLSGQRVHKQGQLVSYTIEVRYSKAHGRGKNREPESITVKPTIIVRDL